MKTAKENGNNITVHSNAVAECRKKQKKVKAELKAANHLNAVYYSAAKPWIDAVKLLRRKENNTLNPERIITNA